MKKLLKSLSLLAICTALVGGISDFCQKKTQGFALSKAISKEPYNPEVADPALSEEERANLSKILDQPFYFIKKGLQCYAFSSADDQYILKVLRWKELEPPFWAKYLPESWTKEMVERKQKKKQHDFTSYRISLDELQEETGMLYLHLQKTKNLNLPLVLYDPIGIKHSIPADNIEFILQKKTDLFLVHFKDFEKQKEELFNFLASLVTIVKAREGRCISDSDISLEYNTGISDGKPILYDIGNLTLVDPKTSPLSPKQFLEKELSLALRWLHQHCPDAEEFLKEKINEATASSD